LRFNVVLGRDEDGVYVASVPELPGCHTQASTLDDLMLRVREAVELYLEVEETVDEGRREVVGLHFIEVPAGQPWIHQG